MITETAPTDTLLLRLFDRHFDDAPAALIRLEKHLKQLTLPFDFRLQLREMNWAAQPKLPDGLPSFIYYFVPKSGWGTVNPSPPDPVSPDFVYAADGIGLNLGCPVRLLRALDMLAMLPGCEQVELRRNLANPSQHLSTVEELLFLTIWKSTSQLRRGGLIPGAKGDVDWAFSSREFPIYLEAKFRPSDWPRLTDQGSFTPIVGSLLSKAAHKFPAPPHEPALYLVGICAFANVTIELADTIGHELKNHPQIHAVVFRTLIQTTHILSLDPIVVEQVHDLLRQPFVGDFPQNYCFLFHIEERNKRVEKRKSPVVPPANVLSSGITCRGLAPKEDEPLLNVRTGDYRTNITSRGPDDEPIFATIPREIWDKKTFDSRSRKR